MQSDPFYNVTSPLEVVNCIQNEEKRMLMEKKAKSPSKEIIAAKYCKFYITDKWVNNSAYKKLFAFQKVVTYQSSSL